MKTTEESKPDQETDTNPELYTFLGVVAE